MQKLGGFPVNSKLTVSTINVFFAGLPRWIPLRLAFLLVFGTSLEYTCGTRVHVRRSSSSGRGFDSSSDCLFLPFFCFFVFFPCRNHKGLAPVRPGP